LRRHAREQGNLNPITCFTSTKVQILTCVVEGGGSAHARQVLADDADDAQASGHALGTYSAALLLIQKLFFSIRPELLRSALILAGHLLRGACAPAADVQVLLALLVQTRVFH
jgi:hypothetical protein